MMRDKMIIASLCIFFFVGTLVGYHYGSLSEEETREECQKTLPRNVECVIVAVPEDDVDNSEVTYHED